MRKEVLNLAEVEVYDIFGNNVALNAAATQSSVYSGHSSHDFVPSRAVNGIKSDDDFMHTNEEQGMMTSLKQVVTNINSQLNSTSSSLTYVFLSAGAWLQINFEGDYQVENVIIYNRETSATYWNGWNRLSNSKVSLIKDGIVQAEYIIYDASNLSVLSIAASEFVSNLLCSWFEYICFSIMS